MPKLKFKVGQSNGAGFEQRSEAEEFLIRALNFVNTARNTRPQLIPNATAWLQECEQILESQRIARRAYVLKRISSFHVELGIPEDQLECFALLQWRLKKDFKLSDCEKTIFNALRSNDYRFFVSLGRLLELPPSKECSRLELLLLQNWTESEFGTPPFCFFTDTALANAIKDEDEELTFDAVRKTRQRAGLMQASIYQVRKAVHIHGHWNLQISFRAKGRTKRQSVDV